jgi:hypothetical protein
MPRSSNSIEAAVKWSTDASFLHNRIYRLHAMQRRRVIAGAIFYLGRSFGLRSSPKASRLKSM